MSENVRFYQHKMAERRARRRLSPQLRDLFEVVADCERRWALEDRIDPQLRRG